VALFHELLAERRADEARCPGDEQFHAGRFSDLDGAGAMAANIICYETFSTLKSQGDLPARSTLQLVIGTEAHRIAPTLP
jgi:hypothetical protein